MSILVYYGSTSYHHVSDNNLEVEELLEVGNINQNIDFKTRMTEILDINIPILLHIETKANHQEFSLLMSGQDFSLLISDQDFSFVLISCRVTFVSVGVPKSPGGILCLELKALFIWPLFTFPPSYRNQGQPPRIQSPNVRPRFQSPNFRPRFQSPNFSQRYNTPTTYKPTTCYRCGWEIHMVIRCTRNAQFIK
jgi:hypothetical protein